MNLVDSSGWLEYLSRGKNFKFFAPALKDTAHLIVPTICFYEVFKRLLIERVEEEALKTSGLMSLGKIVELTREIAVNAANISFESKIPMADSIILATARAYQAIIWTQDADFAGIEGVQFISK